MATIDRLQQAFPGKAQPATVAVEADVDASATTAAIAELRRQALTSGQMGRPIDLEVNRGHTLARVTVPLVGDGTDARSNAALGMLRERILPATVGTLPGASYAVTGGTAGSADSNALLKRSWPRVFAFVLTFDSCCCSSRSAHS